MAVAASVIHVSQMTAADGFVIMGDSAGDWAGVSVSDAGDVNGDGLDDVIIGAVAGSQGGLYSGQAYVIFGAPGKDRAQVHLSALGSQEGFILQGANANDFTGRQVSSAGDINGDGVDDLIISAVGVDFSGLEAGASYVVFGRVEPTRTGIDLNHLGMYDGFVIQGHHAGDSTGSDVSSAGDINGDHIDDLIVSAMGGDRGDFSAGDVYIIFGKLGQIRGDIDLSTIRGSNGFLISGAKYGDQTGRSVSSAGDINGDGVSDILIGAAGCNDVGANSGKIYVVYGKLAGIRADIDLANLAAKDGFSILPEGAGDGLGWGVTSVGDVNGDGIDDILVSAPYNDEAGIDAGKLYVIFGNTDQTRPNIDLRTLSPEDGFTLIGSAGDADFPLGDYAGYSVSSAGDFNGDGIADLLISAHQGSNTGRAYVVFGADSPTRTNINLANLTAQDGVIIEGPGGWFGRDVSSAGDVNNDGYDDLIIGAPLGNSGTGAAYVIYGSPSLSDPSWSFYYANATDMLLFAHLATDAYDGDLPGAAPGSVIRPPAGWTAVLTTWDGLGPVPVDAAGNPVAAVTVGAAGMQATAYREDATGRVVIAYRGTDGGVLGELISASISLGLGLTTNTATGYLQSAVDFYAAVVQGQAGIGGWAATDPNKIAFSGHSLGGILAGFMAGQTSAQGMIFDSGPQSELLQGLGPLIDWHGLAHLAEVPDYSGLVHTRVDDEILGAGVSLATQAAWVGLFVSSGMGNAAATSLFATLLAIWGNAAVEGTPLPDLESGLSANLFSLETLEYNITQHSMPLLEMTLYAEHDLGYVNYKTVEGFLWSFFNGDIAKRASQATGTATYLTAGEGDAGNLFRDMVLSVGDGAGGLEDVLTPLLNDVEHILAPLAGSGIGLGFSIWNPISSIKFEASVLNALSEHYVETATRALIDGGVTYAAALGQSHAGAQGEWLRLVPFGFGTQQNATLGLINLQNVIEDLMDFPAGGASIVSKVNEIYVLANPDLGRSLTGTILNDLIIGAVDSLGQGIIVNGALGNDVLIGTTGNDRLIGGGGNNLLLGGTGRDIYVASADAGANTTILDFGGADTLNLWGQIVGYSNNSNYAYVADSLSLQIGTQGAAVEIIDYYDSRLFDGAGFIERIVTPDGQVWRPTSMIETAFGVIEHTVSSVVANTAAFVAAADDAVDLVRSTADNLISGAVHILGAGLGDLVNIVGSSLSNLNVQLNPWASPSLARGVSAAASATPTNYTIDLDFNLDGITDATITLLGSGAGMSLVVTSEANGTNIGFEFDPALQFDLFGENSVNDILNGTSGADRIGGLSGNDALIGSAGADDLFGGEDADKLNGGRGADEMYGGKGNDLYFVDAAADIVVEYANEGTDTVRSLVSFSLLTPIENLVLTGAAAANGAGNRLDNRLIGNGFNNLLSGEEGNDRLLGDGGDDSLKGGAGNDLLNGGAGQDTVIFNTINSIVIDMNQAAAQNTGEGFDTFIGIENILSGSGDDQLTGNGQKNGLFGGAGNDGLLGGSGDDSLFGGDGNDQLQGNLGADLFDGGGGTNQALFITGNAVVVDLSLTGPQATGDGMDTFLNIQDVTSGNGNDQLTGNYQSNALSAGNGSDVLSGNEGNDTLLGGIGVDILNGGSGDDQLNGGQGIDTVAFSGPVGVSVNLSLIGPHETGFGVDTLISIENVTSGVGNDLLTGNIGQNRLSGGTGDDTLAGAGGADDLDGGDGNDILNGGFGADVMTGGVGNDVYVVDQASDVVIETLGGGADEVRSVNILLNLASYANVENATLVGTLALNATGSVSANILNGNNATNILAGLAGNDVLVGNAGNDTLRGGGGADIMAGGLGQDLMTGGVGADIFLFASASEAGLGSFCDEITDFGTGVDRVEVSAFMAGGNFIGEAAFSNTAGEIRFVSASFILQGDVNGDGAADFSIKLDGVTALSVADFIF